MTLRHTLLALVVITATAAASAAQAQNVEGPRQRLGNPSTLRIAPLEGQGPVQNIVDLLNHRGADAAVVASDVLTYLREGRLAGAASAIAYIRALDAEEVHILARQDIAGIADLAGKKVNFGPRDSRSFITGSVLFQALQINVQPVSLDQAQALQLLRQGQIAALVLVAKSPARLFFDVNRDDRVHFLAVPFTQPLSRIYLSSQLAPADYPLLIGGGEAGRGAPVVTVAVPIVLAVNSYALQAAGERETSQLLRADLSRAIAQQGPSTGARPRTDLAMEVPGWRRFVPGESRPRGPANASPANASTEPQSKTQQGGGTQRMTAPSAGPYTDQQKQALYRDFLRWRAQFPSSQRQPEASEDVFNEFMRSLGSSSPGGSPGSSSPGGGH